MVVDIRRVRTTISAIRTGKLGLGALQPDAEPVGVVVDSVGGREQGGHIFRSQIVWVSIWPREDSHLVWRASGCIKWAMLAR